MRVSSMHSVELNWSSSSLTKMRSSIVLELGASESPSHCTYFYLSALTFFFSSSQGETRREGEGRNVHQAPVHS